ncbi:hypothetical protein FG93_01128 [Bosea sp. LC85]|nr:hypothetical protein FG93_01128 [Bosea sp. LC85]
MRAGCGGHGAALSGKACSGVSPGTPFPGQRSGRQCWRGTPVAASSLSAIQGETEAARFALLIATCEQPAAVASLASEPARWISRRKSSGGVRAAPGVAESTGVAGAPGVAGATGVAEWIEVR